MPATRPGPHRDTATTALFLAACGAGKTTPVTAATPAVSACVATATLHGAAPTNRPARAQTFPYALGTPMNPAKTCTIW